MIMKNPIVHFEIPVDDVERAKKFYEETFGWEIKKFDMPDGDAYWIVHAAETDKDNMVKKGGQINGGMMKRKNPGQPFMNYIAVDSIDKFLKTIEAHGGKICLEKQEIGRGMGWIGAFQDPEGNLMGLHEVPESMKQ